MARYIYIYITLALAFVATAAAAASESAAPERVVAPPAGPALAELAKPPVRTHIASERFYFVMTDRYANGDPSNDRGGKTGPRTVTGYDPTDIGFFHGGDFKGLTADLPRLKDLGFTAVWVTPPFGQRYVQGDSAAYHGYWITDFTSVDPHLGTNADFEAFVDAAHALGLKVYLDVVVNHTADVVTVASSYSDAPYRDCKGRVFDPARYASGKRFPCLRAAGMPHVPNVLPSMRNLKKPAWLNDPLRYHNRGDIAFDSCSEQCFEQGDFFGLDDLFTEQPRVADGLADIYADWIRRYEIDGFRIDTARHVNRAFFHRWIPRIRAAARAAGVRDFEIFGEVFVSNAIDLVPFVHERGLPNLLDFPLQDAIASFAGGEASARAISARLADDDYFAKPSGLVHTPPTFLGNHDMGRAALKIDERSEATGSELLRRVLLGHSLLYLLRGAPVVYYGDEFGIRGGGGDKAARQDLFATQVRGWQTEERVGSPPIGTASSFARADHPIAQHLRGLARLRAEHPALATGATAVRSAGRSVLALSRFDAAARREYVVVVNAGNSAATVRVQTATPSAQWTALLGSGSPASAAGGALTVAVPALSTLVLRADADLPVRAPAQPRLTVARDDFTDLWRLSAAAGGGPVSVSFAVRRAGRKTWQRLAADDSPPYRAFLDPRRFRRGEQVQLVAVVRGLDGSTAVSAVTPFTVRPT